MLGRRFGRRYIGYIAFLVVRNFHSGRGNNSADECKVHQLYFSPVIKRLMLGGGVFSKILNNLDKSIHHFVAEN
jgi:hypothetical protein